MTRTFAFGLCIALLTFAGMLVVAQQPAAPAERVETVDFETILNRPVKPEFVETPLADVMHFFADQFDINIVLDAKGLTDAAVDPAAPVTFSLRKPVSLRAALRLILDEFDLTFVVDNEVLKITSKEKGDEILTTRVYAAGDLLDRARRRGSFTGLTKTITETIEPDSWADNGGPGSISQVDSTLVVTQKPDVHREIVNLFAQLRGKLEKQSLNADAAASDTEEVTIALYKLRHASGADAMQAIMSVVSPESWGNNGGSIHVVPMKDVIKTAQDEDDRSWEALVIRQKQRIQDEVNAFLEELSRLQSADVTMGGSPLHTFAP